MTTVDQAKETFLEEVGRDQIKKKVVYRNEFIKKMFLFTFKNY